MAEFQPPEGLLREIALKMCSAEPGTSTEVAGTKVVHGFHGSDKPCQWCLFDAARALAALFEACEVRERPHMWLHGGIRTERALVLRFPLPDEPMPEPGPMPPEIAEALEPARAAVSSTGEEKTDRG